jgi:pSer/pThr/pTyr-binding forkhead associated (FHA) protein
MPARLISLDGRGELALRAGLVVVGRSPASDLRLDSSRVSRHHCCLALDPCGVLVRDLESTNGTWINGIRVSDGLLRPGDELAIAHIRFRLESSCPPRPARPAEPGDTRIRAALQTPHEPPPPQPETEQADVVP